MNKHKNLHPDLVKFQEQLYKAFGWSCNNIISDEESKEYVAYSFEMNSKKILFRVAKITPTKIGQFVTLWKRSKQGPIAPYDARDGIDLVIICVSSPKHQGLFLFPKDILIEKDVFSHNAVGGKRAIRVYPVWDNPDSPQAKRTQAWQLKYFMRLMMI